jgi:hypothetical protein
MGLRLSGLICKPLARLHLYALDEPCRFEFTLGDFVPNRIDDK